MRVGIDATPLLGPRTGVGRYVAGLVEGFGELAGQAPGGAPGPDELVLVPFTWRGTRDLPAAVPETSARYAELVSRGLGRGAVVCTPTAAVAAEVAEAYGVPGDRVVVTPLGVAPAWHAAVPPSAAWLAARGLPPRYLLFVGSREPRKGLDVLLAAYRELLAGDRDVPPLVLAGPPGWGAALDLAGLPEGAVRLPGYLPEDELASLTAGAAALVFPSRYEGFGLPPLQALACGTAVVASDLPALAEVLGAEADLVPAGDAGALAGALAGVLKDDGGVAARAARRARAAAFTWPACARATLAAYARAREGER